MARSSGTVTSFANWVSAALAAAKFTPSVIPSVAREIPNASMIVSRDASRSAVNSMSRCV
jgi:hypothetical protein